MGQIRIFLDSDVVIASLLSKTGASWEIISKGEQIKAISKTVRNEVIQNAQRLKIALDEAEIFKNTAIITLNLDKERLAKDYLPYVYDPEDSHVVAGAHKSKSAFLLTHNLKHYKVSLIKEKLGITVLKPGQFLQYIRAQEIP